MLEGKLLYYAIFVFFLLITGLVLTIFEYKRIGEQDVLHKSSEGKVEKRLKLIKF